MDEEVKQQVARFRFGVIADLVGRKLTRGEKQRILREKSQAEWEIPHSARTRISRSTVLYWLRRYEESGGRLESLYPDHRSDKDTSRALEAETAQALIRLKQEYRGATLPAVLREAKRRGVVPAQFHVSKATLYRFFKRQGPDEDSSPPVDRRRFEAELPNDIWQSDARHGPHVLVERTPGDVVHDEVETSGGLAAVMDRDNVGVIQRCQDLGFALEAGQPFRISGKGIGQELESNLAIQGGIVSQEDHAHASFADLLDHLIVAQRSADHKATFLQPDHSRTVSTGSTGTSWLADSILR